ncbi:MAG: CvpA family protein, partial [Deltaproteobacteria bacterium]|nr:CvpA family protein [Deltaproteobacteria bacterium]
FIGLAERTAGIFIASCYWEHLATAMNQWVKHEHAAKWLSISVIVIIVGIAVDMLHRRVQATVEKGPLNWMNRMIGAGFGVALACLMLGFVFLLLMQYGITFGTNTIVNSRFGPILAAFAQHTIGMTKPFI